MLVTLALQREPLNRRVSWQMWSTGFLYLIGRFKRDALIPRHASLKPSRTMYSFI